MTAPDDLEWTITLHIPTIAGEGVLHILQKSVYRGARETEYLFINPKWEIHIVTDGPHPAEQFDPEEVES